MIPQTIPNFLLTMATGIFLLGLITFSIGIFILVIRSGASQEMRTIAQQTTRIAQKGIAEDISGLVGNSAALIDSLNQLIKTTTGIGVFLVFIGIALIAGSYFLIRTLLQQ